MRELRFAFNTTYTNRYGVNMFKNPANCADTETDEWFVNDNSKTYDNINILKRICSSCLAQDECREYSIEWNVQGYWAGTSEEQRRNIRRKLNIIPRQIVTNEWEWNRKYA